MYHAVFIEDKKSYIETEHLLAMIKQGVAGCTYITPYVYTSPEDTKPKGYYYLVSLQETPNRSRNLKGLIIELLHKLDDQQVPYIALYGQERYHLYFPASTVRYTSYLSDKWNLACAAFQEKFVQVFPAFKEYVDPSTMAMEYQTLLIYSKNDHGPMVPLYLTGKGKDMRLKAYAEMTVRVGCLLYKAYPESQHGWLFDEAFVLHSYQSFGPVDSTLLFPKDVKRCIYRMLHHTEVKGQRHQVALRIMGYFGLIPYPPAIVRGIVDAWNSALVDPLPFKEIEKLFRTDKYYAFSCSDKVLAHWCVRDCPFDQRST